MASHEPPARIAELSGVTVEEVKAWTPEELRRRADASRIACKASGCKIPITCNGLE